MAQGQSHLHGRRPPAMDGDRLGCFQAVTPGQKGFQGFHRQGPWAALAAFPTFCRTHFRTHIEAEQVPGQGRPARQHQLLAGQIHGRDLRLHEGDAGQGAQPPQIDGAFLRAVEPCHQARHHAGIEGGAVAVHQGD